MGPRPDVIVDFLFDEGLLFLVITNIGAEPAVRVQTAFNPRFKGLEGTVPIAELPLFRNIEYLAPARSIRTFLDSSAAFFARQEPEKIAVTISYADRAGQRYSTTIHHDLAIYRDLTFIPRIERK